MKKEKQNKKGEIKYKKTEPKVIKVNLSLFVGIIFAILIVLSSSFLGYKVATVGTKIMHSLVEEIEADESLLSDGDTENYEDEVDTASTVSDDGTSTSSFSIDENYKATDELTDEDMEDEYQKNYQETTVDDDNYLIKTAEWTDKENGEALITINGSLTVEPEETTALYVATLCYSHGLTEDIIVENIQYLAENYDNVDFIVVEYNPDRDDNIYDTVTYNSASTEDEIRNYIQTCWNNYGYNGTHFTYTIVPALEYYLFGGLGDSYISEDNMINDPLAIYVSFDGFYNADYVGWNNKTTTELQFIDDNWAVKYGTETFFNFLDIYFGDAYMTMSVPENSSYAFLWVYDFLEKTEYNDQNLNVLLGLLQPENYGLASTIMTEEYLEIYTNTTFNSNGYIGIQIAALPQYGADYTYAESFEKAGVKIIVGATIVDVVVGEYEIVSVEAYDSSGNEITVTINGQTVTITDPDYVTGDEITILIYIKLNSSVATNFDDFLDTNEGTATMSNNFNGESVEVSSPKLVPNTNSYKVQYVDLNTGEIIKDEKTEENIAINTEITATNEVIEIDDYTYVKASEDTLTVTSDENVLILYYAKTTSVIVYYLDYYTDEEIAESETIDGYEGLSYTTEQKEIDEYTYLSNSGNTEGTMSSETTYVYYYYEQLISITITKVSTETSTDEGGNTVYTYLEGVQFQLDQLICENSSHEHDTDEDLIDTADYDEDCWKLIGTYTTGSDGTLMLNDLPITGIYRLVETKTIEDYVLPSGQWKIEFDYDDNLTGTTYTVNEVELQVTGINNPPAISLIDDTLYLYNIESYDIPTTGLLGFDDFWKIGVPIILMGMIIYPLKKRRKVTRTKFESLRNSVNDARRIIENCKK